MPSKDKKIRLAILASHPIEYQGPLFQKLAKEPEIELHVYYCWKFGVGKETFDPGFNRTIKWDLPLLEGYSWSFLRNLSLRPSGKFWGEVNPGIITKINKKRHDALIVLGWSSMTSWLAYFTAFFRGVPVFMRGENPYSQEFSKPAYKRIFKRPLLRLLFGITAGILYIGKENRRFYEFYGAPKEKLFFVPYAVDNERFMRQRDDYADQKEKLKKEIGIVPGKMVILFVGKLIPLKRPLDLARAYSKINGKAVLLYVGDGILRPELEKYAAENNLKNLKVLGFKNQTELARYYSIGDVFALLSDSETWGLVVNEAMCFGLPIVISDVPGCGPDLVRHGENGYVFPVGNVAALAQKLADLLDNPEQRKEFGRKSLEIIRDYSYQKDIEEILRILHETII